MTWICQLTRMNHVGLTGEYADMHVQEAVGEPNDGRVGAVKHDNSLASDDVVSDGGSMVTGDSQIAAEKVETLVTELKATFGSLVAQQCAQSQALAQMQARLRQRSQESDENAAPLAMA